MKPQYLLLSPLLLTLAVSCSIGSGGRIKVMPDVANRMSPEAAPTPYSAAQIRAFCDRGRRFHFLVESRGKPKVIQIMQFGMGDESHAVLTMSATDETGQAIGEPQQSRSKWSDLQAHASFADARTQIVQDRIQVLEGTHECWVYRVAAEDGVRGSETLYCFAKDIHGPPILMETKVAGELTMRMTLQETTRRVAK